MVNHRQKIQLFFLGITLYAGVKFYFYIHSLADSTSQIIKPGAVEGFLPISALMALKQWIMTGIFDPIHPAGLTIFIAAIVISILLNKSFCSHICPVGFISETVSRFGLNKRIHKWIYYLIVSIKYLLLAFFANTILLQMPSVVIGRFLNSPYNKIADAKMMEFFTAPSLTTSIVLSVLILLSLVFKNIWCRFLCPYGALLGIFAAISPFKIKRSASACINCKQCTVACPMSIDVHQKNTVRNPDCMGCYECIRHRQNDECLQVKRLSLPIKTISAIVVALFFGIIAIAMLTGNWQSSVSNLEYGEIFKQIHRLSH